jgi:hypothetical protein
VFSTALKDVCLMLQCVECGAVGTVNDPTLEEWREAYHAPSTPYQWEENNRVEIIHEAGEVPPYVEKAV